MFHTILEIAVLNIVSGVLSVPPLLLYLLKLFESIVPTIILYVVSTGIAVLNIMFVVCLDIAIGWKIFFIAGFVLAIAAPISELSMTFSAPYIINCMFPAAVANALHEHTLPTAWLANKVYMWSDIVRPDIDNKTVLFVFCVIAFLALLSEGAAAFTDSDL